jgi:hypothetical protein
LPYIIGVKRNANQTLSIIGDDAGKSICATLYEANIQRMFEPQQRANDRSIKIPYGESASGGLQLAAG